jgi:hypothetical protein
MLTRPDRRRRTGPDINANKAGCWAAATDAGVYAAVDVERIP